MNQMNLINRPTGRESRSISIYLQEIRQSPVLSAGEENQLILDVRQGAPKALETLLKANLRFVVVVAKQYQNLGLSLPDLISEGNLGLLKAIERYDETRGFRFISYAVWWIRESIIRAIEEYGNLIRLPRNKQNELNKINRAFWKFEQQFEREPSSEELADILKVNPRVVERGKQLRAKPISLDAPVPGNANQNVIDQLEIKGDNSPEQKMKKDELLKEEVNCLLEGLIASQCRVVKMCYGLEGEEEVNLIEIGKRLKVSSERIRQIKQDALRNIKRSKKLAALREYV